MSGGGPEDDPLPYWLSTTIVVLTIAGIFATTISIVFFEGAGH